MFDITEVRDGAARWVSELEPGVFDGPDALALLDVVSDVKQLPLSA